MKTPEVPYGIAVAFPRCRTVIWAKAYTHISRPAVDDIFNIQPIFAARKQVIGAYASTISQVPSGKSNVHHLVACRGEKLYLLMSDTDGIGLVNGRTRTKVSPVDDEEIERPSSCRFGRFFSAHRMKANRDLPLAVCFECLIPVRIFTCRIFDDQLDPPSFISSPVAVVFVTKN